jgi:hypothetical protein
LIQLADPDALSNAAKEEKTMLARTQLQRRPARSQPINGAFEQASLSILRHYQRVSGPAGGSGRSAAPAVRSVEVQQQGAPQLPAANATGVLRRSD